jgi:hypothetical protein
MDSQSTMHAYLDWAKGRLDESSATKLQADTRTKAESALANMRTARDAFRKSMKDYGQASEAALARSKEALESQWNAFEASVQTYLDSTGKQVKDQQAAFLARAAAQRKAWQESIDTFHRSTASFAADRRDDMEKVLDCMTTEADAANVKLDKLNKAGSESWAAMKSALSETRDAMDRAQKAALDAFKRAS